MASQAEELLFSDDSEEADDSDEDVDARTIATLSKAAASRHARATPTPTMPEDAMEKAVTVRLVRQQTGSSGAGTRCSFASRARRRLDDADVEWRGARRRRDLGLSHLHRRAPHARLGHH